MVVINKYDEKNIFIFLLSISAFAQQQDTVVPVYKKRVLEAAEVEFIGSYYKQDGKHSAVSGGIGTEQLTDVASNMVLMLPLNADDVLTIDAGFSAYTSASSSNINPFLRIQDMWIPAAIQELQENWSRICKSREKRVMKIIQPENRCLTVAHGLNLQGLPEKMC